MNGRRRGGIAATLVLLPALLGVSAGVSLARLTDSATTTASFTTDTLNPPTSLAATGGGSAALTWVATVDAYASGYELQRATVSGGPYAVVASVTPRTVTATADTPPASGTYYYVLRSVFQNWRSVDSNQAAATVTIGSTPTGYKTCTAASNAADTGGDNDGYETTPANACGDDAATASDASSGTNATISCTNAGKDRHRFWDFGLGVPATVTSIDGIQVRLDEGMNNNGGTTQVCIELSWNGGATWTTPKSQALGATAITTYTLGSATDTWGRAWSAGDFTNANFRLRVVDVTSQPNKTFLLEYLAVQVSYTP